VTVGHFSIDLIISPKIASPKPTLGGSPTYASLSAKRLGIEEIYERANKNTCTRQNLT
jgi:hypothetical protein